VDEITLKQLRVQLLSTRNYRCYFWF